MSDIETIVHPFGICIEAKQDHSNVLKLDIADLRGQLFAHDLLILRGFQLSDVKKDFLLFCKRWGRISKWPFGEVLELIEHQKPKDHIFDHSYVPLHWDGMYRQEVAELQIFHCVQAPTQSCGGKTVFTHTPRVLQLASRKQLNDWRALTCTYTRKMDFYDSKTTAPVITKHPYLEREVIRYCEAVPCEDKDFINHPEIRYSGIDSKQIAQVKKGLESALNSSEVQYKHTWHQGDILIANNFTLLHGREAFTKGSPRHLRRVHISSTTPYANPFLESYK